MEIDTNINIVFRNTSYPLKITLERKSNTITTKIIIPDDYPKTPFVEMLGKDKKFGEIVFVIMKEYNDVYLSSFVLYINKLYYQKSVIPEERIAFRGIGKKILKFVLNLFRDEIINYTITLQAAGGECDPKTLESLTYDESINIIKRHPRFYDMIKEFVGVEEKRKFIIEQACDIVKNMKLVEYYKTMGLKVVDDSEGIFVKMSGNVRDLI